MSIKISYIFSSEATVSNEFRFYLKYLKGTKSYISSPGQMTKMAGMPIYSKTL